MITKAQRTKLQRVINRLLRAQSEYDFRGAGHPEDIPGIEEEYRKAKNQLKRELDFLTDTTRAK